MKVSVKVPASIANVGPGFDVFAIAVEKPFEIVTVTYSPSDTASVLIESKGKYKVPAAASLNTAGISVMKFLEECGITGEFLIEIDKNIRPSGGLGSSGASAAGALFALNHMYRKYSMDDLIRVAASGEIISSGTVHHDNVSASLMGGFVMNDGVNFIRLSGIKLPIALITPSLEVKTSLSREALGANISVAEMKQHISASSFLLHSIMKGDLESVGKFVNLENVVEKRRSRLISGYDEVKKAALKNGALGVSISGSGPSLFAISKVETLDNVARAMADAFRANGIEAEHIITGSSDEGATVID